MRACVCVRARVRVRAACVRARARACVCVCVRAWFHGQTCAERVLERLREDEPFQVLEIDAGTMPDR